MRIIEAGSGAGTGASAAVAPRLYHDGRQGWADILYTYLVTSHAWADLAGRFAKPAQRTDFAALAEVKGLLRQLIGQSADTLGIDRAALDELRTDRLVNRDGLSRRWPTLPREVADTEGRTRQRLQLLRDLNDQVKLLGLDLGLGGEVPPHGGGPLR
jgi:Icc protein